MNADKIQEINKMWNFITSYHHSFISCYDCIFYSDKTLTFDNGTRCTNCRLIATDKATNLFPACPYPQEKIDATYLTVSNLTNEILEKTDFEIP